MKEVLPVKVLLIPSVESSGIGKTNLQQKKVRMLFAWGRKWVSEDQLERGMAKLYEGSVMFSVLTGVQVSFVKAQQTASLRLVQVIICAYILLERKKRTINQYRTLVNDTRAEPLEMKYTDICNVLHQKIKRD